MFLADEEEEVEAAGPWALEASQTAEDSRDADRSLWRPEPRGEVTRDGGGQDGVRFRRFEPAPTHPVKETKLDVGGPFSLGDLARMMGPDQAAPKAAAKSEPKEEDGVEVETGDDQAPAAKPVGKAKAAKLDVGGPFSLADLDGMLSGLSVPKVNSAARSLGGVAPGLSLPSGAARLARSRGLIGTLLGE